MDMSFRWKTRKF